MFLIESIITAIVKLSEKKKKIFIYNTRVHNN